MSRPTRHDCVQALLVLPRLRVQSANAISSPLTHGFPSITAFAGLMWALQRKLAAAGIPLKLRQFGVICHHHEEQVADGYVKTFCQTRNPVGSKGETVAIVEEGRIHLDITLIFAVTVRDADAFLIADRDAQRDQWASQIGEIVATMRIAGGTLLLTLPMPGRRVRPWMAELPGDAEERAERFARWRRQWLPGYALIGRDDLLTDRYDALRKDRADATLLDAWLHAARFNYKPVIDETSDAERQDASDKKLRWADLDRQKGAGWTVPMTVGYAALKKPLPPGSVANARDPSIPFVFVEAVYSFGQWISPHRLSDLHELLWRAETDLKMGLYRCRSGYSHDRPDATWVDDDLPEFD
ncbi:type I-F CRISPR-associated protein Csy2 [Caballeronia megalochromosomata]|jgi:CRISPR-associated protein Csy2|nr:type I-F CRISPR-associated protein Csy2 [Caballeronia megalochromosomata]